MTENEWNPYMKQGPGSKTHSLTLSLCMSICVCVRVRECVCVWRCEGVCVCVCIRQPWLLSQKQKEIYAISFMLLQLCILAGNIPYTDCMTHIVVNHADAYVSLFHQVPITAEWLETMWNQNTCCWYNQSIGNESCCMEISHCCQLRQCLRHWHFDAFFVAYFA